MQGEREGFCDCPYDGSDHGPENIDVHFRTEMNRMMAYTIDRTTRAGVVLVLRGGTR